MGTNALHLAAYLNRDRILSDLLQGVDTATVDVKDDWGLTPLFVAWANESKKSFNCLLKAGADPFKATPWPYTNKCVALSAECSECAGDQLEINGYTNKRHNKINEQYGFLGLA